MKRRGTSFGGRFRQHSQCGDDVSAASSSEATFMTQRLPRRISFCLGGLSVSLSCPSVGDCFQFVGGHSISCIAASSMRGIAATVIRTGATATLAYHETITVKGSASTSSASLITVLCPPCSLPPLPNPSLIDRQQLAKFKRLKVYKPHLPPGLSQDSRSAIAHC